MTDDLRDIPEPFILVDRQYLLATLSFALTHDSRLAKTQAADVMASIVAERILVQFDAANFVVMRRPGLGHVP